MSLYLNPKNTSIIWQTLQTYPPFSEVFDNPESRKMWFGNILNQFSINASSMLPLTVLHELNSKTVKFMIEDLKRKQLTKNDNKMLYSNQPSRESDKVISSDVGFKFEQRQKEYEDMRKESIPEPINFSIVNDEPIQNINDLLEKHKKDREIFLAFDKSKVISDDGKVSKLVIHNSIDDGNVPKLSIDDVVEFSINEPPNTITNGVDKKRVNWNDDKMKELEGKLDQIDSKIRELGEKLDDMYESKLKELEENFDQTCESKLKELEEKFDQIYDKIPQTNVAH